MGSTPTWTGTSETSLQIANVRGCHAVAPQFPHLFGCSLGANPRLGRPMATGAEIRRALELAGLSTLLEQRRAGHNWKLGALGARLSVGQAGRVAIAQAWLTERPALLIVEPTEALDDATSERRLIDNLLAATPRRTLIAVTQSAGNFSQFDRVVVVDDHASRESPPGL